MNDNEYTAFWRGILEAVRVGTCTAMRGCGYTRGYTPRSPRRAGEGETMDHRYIVWTGRHRGRYYKEMHICGPSDMPICTSRKPASLVYETIYSGRPEGYALCRYCSKKRVGFEQAEKLRTWQELARG